MKEDHANMPGMDHSNMPGMVDQAKIPEQGKPSATPQKAPEAAKPAAPASPDKGSSRKA